MEYFYTILGPRSRQSSVEANDPLPPMNTEEVYRNLRKTTAEIQNYSFETKLGRDTNSKDSGISQMDDHHHVAVTEQIQQQHYYTTQLTHQQQATNGYNGHLLSLDKEDSCNGSKTQSSATTESNTPDNTVRVDSQQTINEVNQRIASSLRHSDNVTFLPNGELVTECEYLFLF